jgi:hypothetical protein
MKEVAMKALDAGADPAQPIRRYIKSLKRTDQNSVLREDILYPGMS